MSKRNNKRTRSQRRNARLIEALRRKGSIEDGAEIDPGRPSTCSSGRSGTAPSARSAGSLRSGPALGGQSGRGGFITADTNLSHEGDCWIYGDAEVSENARVSDNAQVRDETLVWGAPGSGTTRG